MAPSSSTWLQERSKALGGLHSVGNKIDLLVDGVQFIPAMLAMIEQAKHQVGYQFFGIEADEGGTPFAQALASAKQKNLQVKIILDWVEMKLQTNGKWFASAFLDPAIRAERKETWKLVHNLRQEGVDVLKYSWKHGFHRNTANL
ncbi:MAG: hypothetical protein R3A11_03990 [Bdellovibrionota bacterium]